MAEFAILFPGAAAEDLPRLFSMLLFQKQQDFRIYLPVSLADAIQEVEDRLSIRLYDGDPGVEEPWTLFLGTDLELTPKSLSRMHGCIQDHPDYDVFHWNLDGEKSFPLKYSVEKLFKDMIQKDLAAPVSSFVLRTSVLKDCRALEPGLEGLPLVFSCARARGIRSARWESLVWHRPVPPSDPVQEEKDIREEIAFLRWTERFFGKEYPLGVGDRLSLFAGTLARLYPSYSPEDLKEMMREFAAAGGAVRSLRASAALKSAIRKRQKALK